MTYQEIQNSNRIIFDRLSLLLNNQPDFINKEMVEELVNNFGLSVADSYSLLLCAALGFDTENPADRTLWEQYSPHMLHYLDEKDFINNPYYSAISLAEKKKIEDWELREDVLAPFTAFVCNDPLVLPNGQIIPQIGFFDKEFKFLSVLQKDREWMTLMPNEIVTQRLPIKKAKGRVATYGLGLGYFAYMCALKEEVESVTIVELDENVIKLFKELLLPQFKNPEKIDIICADAFEFAEKQAPQMKFDYIFADIWHDPSDGVSAYKKFKELEHLCPETQFDYWIENTLKLYM